MNPLSPFTYYRRHKQSALLLVVLISLATLGVCVMVRLLDALESIGHRPCAGAGCRVADPGASRRGAGYPRKKPVHRRADEYFRGVPPVRSI